MSDFSATNTQSGQNLVRALSALGAALGVGNGAGYVHVSNAGTIVATEEPWALMTVNINGASVGATGTIYDAASGAALGSDPVVGIFEITSTTPVPSRLSFGPDGTGLQLDTGMVLVTTGTIDLTLGLRSS